MYSSSRHVERTNSRTKFMVLYPNFQWGKSPFCLPPADGHESEVAQKIGDTKFARTYLCSRTGLMAHGNNQKETINSFNCFHVKTPCAINICWAESGAFLAHLILNLVSEQQPPRTIRYPDNCHQR